MSRIEAGLHDHHSTLQNTPVPPLPGANSTSQSPDAFGTRESGALEAPFARVNSVVTGSPADEAGLRAGDRIRSFGMANCINHEKLSKVAEVVQASEGVGLFIAISKRLTDHASSALSMSNFREMTVTRGRCSCSYN